MTALRLFGKDPKEEAKDLLLKQQKDLLLSKQLKKFERDCKNLDKYIINKDKIIDDLIKDLPYYESKDND